MRRTWQEEVQLAALTCLATLLAVLVLLWVVATIVRADDMPVGPGHQRYRQPLPPGLAFNHETPERPEDPPPPPDETDPPELYGEQVPTAGDSIIYVVDVSGSMGDGPDSRLGQAKAELRASIGALPPSWSFNVVVYDCSVRSMKRQRVYATDQNKREARDWVDALDSGGGTGTWPAVAVALDDRDNRTIALLSDGRPNCPIPWGQPRSQIHRENIDAANLQRAKIHTFYVGNGHSDTEAFMRAVAADSGGVYRFVP